ncbi:MAG: hypothetical protein LBF74_12715, partial [Treponema sp.]|nr:hypothetical protein [Treponema sp.]
MKKIIVLSVLFGVLAGGAYAQVVLGGEMYTGIALDIPYEGDESFGVKHREEGKTLFKLNASASKDRFGAKLDTSFSKLPDGEPAGFSVEGIYGWAYFLDKQIRLTLGNISDAVWVSSLDNEYHLDDV